MKEKIREIMSMVPSNWKATAKLQGFGLTKVPLLFSVQPKVRRMDDDRAEIEIPLNRWTKNHLRSMYFGSLAMGADCVIGMHALHHIETLGEQDIHLSFKDFRADFLRRAESNVLFVSEAGVTLKDFVQSVVESGERKNITVPGHAIELKSGEIVMKFHLTLSLKKKS